MIFAKMKERSICQVLQQQIKYIQSGESDVLESLSTTSLSLKFCFDGQAGAAVTSSLEGPKCSSPRIWSRPPTWVIDRGGSD